MNKHITLLAAGALLALAACNSGKDTGAGTMTQAQIDSAVNARAAEQAARLQRNSDSLLNATAVMRADSTRRADSLVNAGRMMQKGADAKMGGAKTVRHTTTTSTETAQPATIGNGKPSMGDRNQTNGKTNGTTIGNGKPKMGG